MPGVSMADAICFYAISWHRATECNSYSVAVFSSARTEPSPRRTKTLTCACEEQPAPRIILRRKSLCVRRLRDIYNASNFADASAFPSEARSRTELIVALQNGSRVKPIRHSARRRIPAAPESPGPFPAVYKKTGKLSTVLVLRKSDQQDIFRTEASCLRP